jgi:hypothetical protein
MKEFDSSVNKFFIFHNLGQNSSELGADFCAFCPIVSASLKQASAPGPSPRGEGAEHSEADEVAF